MTQNDDVTAAPKIGFFYTYFFKEQLLLPQSSYNVCIGRDMVYNIFLSVRSEPSSCGTSDNPVQNRWDIFHKRLFMEHAPLPPVNNVDPTLYAQNNFVIAHGTSRTQHCYGGGGGNVPT